MPIWVTILIQALPQLLPILISVIDDIIKGTGGTPPPTAPAFLDNLRALRDDLAAMDASNVKLGLRKP